MQKYLALSLALIIGLMSALPGVALAKPTKAPSNIVRELSKKPKNRIASEQELFISMVDVIAEYGEIPASYQYITVPNAWVPEGSRLYRAYQKAVYMDILKPSQIPLILRGQAKHQKLVDLTNLFYGVKVGDQTFVDGNVLSVVNKKLTFDDLSFYASSYLASKSGNSPIEDAQGYEILVDAYNKLMTEHYDHNKIEGRNLIYGAIEGMANASGDKFTTYFPPVASQEFSEEINGEFEGIGAYVDMPKPGEFMIQGTIPGSPAEAAGVIAGDRVLKIDDYEITKDTSIRTAVSKIKGPSGSKVTLTILRNGETLTKILSRKRIKVELVTYKLLDSNTSYINISSFGNGTTDGFNKWLATMAKDGTKRLIIDLRNDGGGDLQEVSNLLDTFIPAREPKIKIRSLERTEVLFSSGDDAILRDKQIIFLANKGTASASEILIGAVQDALGARVKVVGETTYGKGSVQTVFPYSDGSSLKYTTAKWFTGGKDRTIDKVGITPDYKIDLDLEKFKSWVDTQLDFARALNY